MGIADHRALRRRAGPRGDGGTGSPLDPRAQGCNLLIREGATLVQSAADVLEALLPIAPHKSAPAESFFNEPVALDADDADRAAIVSLLSPVPVPVDELIRQSGLWSATVQTVLLELEIAGRLVRHAGGRVALSHGPPGLRLILYKE